MPSELRRYGKLIEQLKPHGKRFMVLQVDHACNRDCSYCGQEHADKTTLAQTFEQIDWIADQGYPIMSYIGGEPFMPTLTPEGTPIYEHTLAAVRHAADKGMFVSITTNGDFFN